MYISDQLVYLQLQKTGCTHIAKLLRQVIAGRQYGRHNRLDEFGSPGNRHIVGSIRNPWDWYVSLWAYSCSKRGGWYAGSTRFRSWKLDYHFRLAMNGQGNSGRLLRQSVTSLAFNITKPLSTWREVYADPLNPELFKKWLGLVFDSRRKYDIGDGYGISPLSSFVGLLTFYYLKLYSQDVTPLFETERLIDHDELLQFDSENNLLTVVIHRERLVDDLLAALSLAGYHLTKDQLFQIRCPNEKKSNSSEHKPPVFYYDSETVELVRERDRFIVEKYEYEGPSEQ